MQNSEKQHQPLNSLAEQVQCAVERLKRLRRSEDQALCDLAPMLRQYTLAAVRDTLDEDEWQECQVAALQAWRTYDGARGAFLSWYDMAARKALSRMPRAQTIHIPVYLRRLTAKVMSYEEQYEAHHGSHPSEAQICKALRIEPDVLANVRLAGKASYCHDIINARGVTASDVNNIDLHMALERLHQHDATVAQIVRLVHLEGYTLEEAGRIAGCSLQSAWRAMRVGMRYLRMAMRNGCDA